MRREEHVADGPRWRVILEARWRDRLQELTELSMAYHAATSDGTEDMQARRLLRRAVAARQRLADTEDALGRVTSGVFGQCEQCRVLIPEGLLGAAPESRYCLRCAVGAGDGGEKTGPDAGQLTTGRGATDRGVTVETAGAGARYR